MCPPVPTPLALYVDYGSNSSLDLSSFGYLPVFDLLPGTTDLLSPVL